MAACQLQERSYCILMNLADLMCWYNLASFLGNLKSTSVMTWTFEWPVRPCRSIAHEGAGDGYSAHVLSLSTQNEGKAPLPEPASASMPCENKLPSCVAGDLLQVKLACMHVHCPQDEVTAVLATILTMHAADPVLITPH